MDGEIMMAFPLGMATLNSIMVLGPFMAKLMGMVDGASSNMIKLMGMVGQELNMAATIIGMDGAAMARRARSSQRATHGQTLQRHGRPQANLMKLMVTVAFTWDYVW